MAQEQAKSPAETEAAALEATDGSPSVEGKSSLEARLAEAKAAEASQAERGSELPKRITLAERLKAEQRKRDDAKRVLEEPAPPPKQQQAPKQQQEEPKPQAPLEFAEPQNGQPQRQQFTRTRRPAGPPPQRKLGMPANDDIPSIGGLIFALQQRPSKTPFLVALVASIVWFIIGGFFAYGLISTQLAGGMSAFLGSASALTAAIAILVPIAIFWFLALLVWRAQELRLMASAMTEVAVRLAEPDRLAEQSVASVGQTIRRQVAAMNDAISRAIGRASELEAMVHSEVAALERSYGENELRVRGLIGELATEREALANNSARVSESLKGVGAQIARDLANASSTIDKKLAERGLQLTELLVARSSEAAEQVHKAQAKVVEAVPGLIDRLSMEQGRLSQVIEGATTNLAALESVVSERTTSLDNTLRERTEALHALLGERINGLENSVAQGALMLDQTLQDRTEVFAASIAQGASYLDNALKERNEALLASVAQGVVSLDNTLRERTEGLTGLLSQGAVLLDNTLQQRMNELQATIGEGGGALDNSLKDRIDAFAGLVAQGTVSLENMLTQRTEGLTGLLSEGAVLLDNTLQQRTNELQSKIGEGAVAIDNTLQQRMNELQDTIGGGGGALDNSLKDRIDAFAGLVAQGTISLENMLTQRTEALTGLVSQGAVALDNTLKQRTEALTQSIAQGAVTLDRTFGDHTSTFASAVDERAEALDKALYQRTAQFTTAVNQGAIALDRTLADRAETFTNALFHRVRAVETAITQQTAALDKTMNERTQHVLAALSDRLKAIDVTFGQRTAEAERMLGEHTRTVSDAFSKQTTQLNQVLAHNHQLMQQTADQVGAQSKEAVTVLTSQTGTLRDVSRGLLEQIHGLTQRFQDQGQAILTAAQALDSSNTKIDSILESRHQSIISLLGTVNGKAQDLDTMMRSYVGMIEGALSQAEARVKQVSSALARDTSGQAQQALAQIVRLREEAQAHTAHAVSDLKGSFEQVITQIGRQLEQMRGQFDQTSHTMREAAQQTATNLDSLRQEMQKRMESLPEQTAQTTAAVRKALTEQIKEIEAMKPQLAHAAQNVVPPAPVAPGSGADPYRQPQGYDTPRTHPLGPRGDDTRGPSPMPGFDTRGRQVSGDKVTSGLAHELAGVSQGGHWPVASSSQPEPVYTSAAQGYGARGASQASQPQVQRGGWFRIDEVARAIDPRTAADVWHRFRTGEPGVLGRHIYTPDGQSTFDEIAYRYTSESDFRISVDRYINDFERLLGEAEQSDPSGRVVHNYLTSDQGRVYLLLAHASGRLQ
ncbi:MAG TPA: hypothetical protein VK984_02805 [Methyloceanibacter sp.]|nr:hypothetical protein [Methyloceanibacter sp.]